MLVVVLNVKPPAGTMKGTETSPTLKNALESCALAASAASSLGGCARTGGPGGEVNASIASAVAGNSFRFTLWKRKEGQERRSVADSTKRIDTSDDES